MLIRVQEQFEHDFFFLAIPVFKISTFNIYSKYMECSYKAKVMMTWAPQYRH